MPTFTAIALDRLLEPGASNSPSSTAKLERRNTTPFPFSSDADDDFKSSATKRVDIPPAHPQLRRRNTVSFATEKLPLTTTRPHISPALYATPEPTPIPDSDSPTSSFPPSSPYIINHKRRGPRLLKSFSDQNVAAAAVVEKEASEVGEEPKKLVNGHSRSLSEEVVVNGHGSRDVEVEAAVDNGSNGDAVVAQDSGINNGSIGGELKVLVGSSSERDGGGEGEDFFDPQESMSFTSNTDGEDCSAERSARANTPMGEFFDAWEELSSESGRQPHLSFSDVEAELREMRLSLLMEIEGRKQAEEALNSMRSQWQMLREKLGAVGLNLPADLPALGENTQAEVDPTEDICRQIQVARFVSQSIGRGIAKAEADAEMEAQLEVKNFEIARLCDRLNYYETMNKEMTQRNQEAIEIARRERQKKRRRQKWVWGSIAAAITLGSAALVWSYLPGEKGSSSTNHHEVSQPSSHK